MLAENIKVIKKKRRLTNQELADLSGVPLNTLSKILCGLTVNPTINTLIALAKAMNCQIWEFFDEGQGHGAYYSRNERELIRCYRKLKPEGKQLVQRHAADLLDYQGKLLTEEPVAALISLPLYLMPTSAGTGQFLDSDTYEMTDFPRDDVPRGATFAVRISGDSMEPDFHDGQIVFVRQGRYIESGDVGIFVLNGEGFIKQLKKTEHHVKLISFNPNYKPIPVSPEDSLRIVGHVLG